MDNMSTADDIEKIDGSLLARGVDEGSYFEVTFADGSKRTEHDTNWSSFSERKVVNYFGELKTVFVSKYHISHISMKHCGLESEIQVDDGCEVYQACRSETLFLPQGGKRTRITGRVLGMVKDDEVMVEYFLNGLENAVHGMKK
jgi:hypothetical protein